MSRLGWVFLLAVSILLTVGTCKGEGPPPQDLLPKCQSALLACDKYATELDNEVKMLQDQVKAYKKQAEGNIDAPIVLYTALGGAASGGSVGELWGGPGGGLKGAITGAVVGAIIGWAIEGLAH